MPFRIIRNTTAKPIADVVVTPDINVASGEAEQKLKECFDNSLNHAADSNLKSIAFTYSTLIESGFPVNKVIEVAVAVFTGFLENNDIDIILAMSDDKDEKISEELFSEVREYVDDQCGRWAIDDAQSRCFAAIDEIPAPLAAERKTSPDKPARAIFSRIRSPKHAGSDAMDYMASEPELRTEDSLDDILKDIYKESFEKHLQKLINKKGLKNSEVYAAANISKQYFSKLLKGQVKPSKEKVLALAVGLRLNMDETVDFLGIAGYALSPISQTDTIVKYFITHEDYSVIKIDIVLYDYGLDPLS